MLCASLVCAALVGCGDDDSAALDPGASLPGRLIADLPTLEYGNLGQAICGTSRKRPSRPAIEDKQRAQFRALRVALRTAHDAEVEATWINAETAEIEVEELTIRELARVQAEGLRLKAADAGRDRRSRCYRNLAGRLARAAER